MSSIFQHTVSCTQECGHNMLTDAALVSAEVPMPEIAPAADDDMDAPPPPQPQRPHSNATVLCYDERMTEHEEGKPNPHPERPDRIRAVMARLKRQGLLGMCVVWWVGVVHV